MKDMIVVEINSHRSERSNTFINIYSDDTRICSFCDEMISGNFIPCELCTKVRVNLILVLLLLHELQRYGQYTQKLPSEYTKPLQEEV
jgi:hypothetical protein